MYKKNAFIWLIYISILFLVIITQRMERIKTGRNIARENAELSRKKARNDYLEFELSKSKSPAYLIAEARKRLNLYMPELDKIYILDSAVTAEQNDTLIAKFFSPE